MPKKPPGVSVKGKRKTIWIPEKMALITEKLAIELELSYAAFVKLALFHYMEMFGLKDLYEIDLREMLGGHKGFSGQKESPHVS